MARTNYALPNIVSFSGTPPLADPAGGSLVVVTGSNFGPAPYTDPITGARVNSIDYVKFGPSGVEYTVRL